MTAHKPGDTPPEPSPPKGGRAAERLRQFEQARGLGSGDAAGEGRTPHAEPPAPPDTKEPKKPAR